MPLQSLRAPIVRIVLPLIAIWAATPVAAEPEDVSSRLLTNTKAFSDASQRGDVAVLKALLDEHVVFFNENGDSSTKDEIVSSATPTPNNEVRMAVTNWRCAVHGDVAVASFIDDQTRDLHGQIFHAQYRSVETWLKEHDRWLMIGSQTLALQIDPAFVTLPASTLDQYVGTYEAASTLKAVITRKGSELALSVNGGPASLQRAELRDVLFTPGSPRTRRIFHRDDHGSVVGFTSRREGHDIVFQRVAAE
jgi:ketosteroid isomerase-like protein